MEWIFPWCSSLKCVLQREADHWLCLEIFLKSAIGSLRAGKCTGVRPFLLCFDSETVLNVCVFLHSGMVQCEGGSTDKLTL